MSKSNNHENFHPPTQHEPQKQIMNNPHVQGETINIVPINPETAKALEITKKAAEKKAYKCPQKHQNIEVDEQSRSIKCLTCGFTLDPFDYILEWAEDGERRMEGLRRIEIQRKINQAEYDDLARKIKNMRAALKRGGRPQPSVEKDHFNMMRWNPEQFNSAEINEKPQ